MKALNGSGRGFLGSYADSDEHDDSTLYKRVDPPLVISGNKIEKGPLDYVIFERSGIGGIEVKNYRTWLYPDTSEVKGLLWKCGDAGVVPVLIARRVPFITFRLFNLSGCLVHENYCQLYAQADVELAGLVRDKNLLGYHDVRVGNEPDGRMRRFVQELLPNLVDGARLTFERFRKLHRSYGRARFHIRSGFERFWCPRGSGRSGTGRRMLRMEMGVVGAATATVDYMYLEVAWCGLGMMDGTSTVWVGRVMHKAEWAVTCESGIAIRCAVACV